MTRAKLAMLALAGGRDDHRSCPDPTRAGVTASGAFFPEDHHWKVASRSPAITDHDRFQCGDSLNSRAFTAVNSSCGIAEKQFAMSVSTTHRRPATPHP